jgi:hypothetical protein
MLKESNIFKLMDLLEDLTKVNEMIQLHAKNPSDFMLMQYKSKRDKLLSYLIDELVKPDLRSAKSFALISKLLEKHYPDLTQEAKKVDESHKLLERLELHLTL